MYETILGADYHVVKCEYEEASNGMYMSAKQKDFSKVLYDDYQHTKKSLATSFRLLVHISVQ